MIRRYLIPYLIYSAMTLACIFLQTAVFNSLQIFHAKPDLLLLIVVISGLKSDWKNGLAAGLTAGFWIDLLNGGYFGTNMIVYALIGAVCGAVGKRFPDRTYEGYFFSAVIAVLLAGFLNLAVFHIVGANLPVGQTIAGTILPMTFYTSLIAFLCLPLILLYRRRKGRKIGRIDLLGNGVIFVRGNEKVDMAKVARQRQLAAKDHRARLDRERRDAYARRKQTGTGAGKVRRGAGQSGGKAKTMSVLPRSGQKTNAQRRETNGKRGSRRK